MIWRDSVAHQAEGRRETLEKIHVHVRALEQSFRGKEARRASAHNGDVTGLGRHPTERVMEIGCGHTLKG